jgi:hypothetical protein
MIRPGIFDAVTHFNTAGLVFSVVVGWPWFDCLPALAKCRKKF